MNDARRAAEVIFREESGRILATLIRVSGSFDLAEEVLQEAFTSALATWPEEGVPDRPGAWITTAAHRKLIDILRRDSVRRAKEPAISYETRSVEQPPEVPDENEMFITDDRLRLMFTCCHPALNPEAQVALTLRTLGGLTTAEIAKAFLVPEPTVAQRLVRGKRKIQDAKIPYQVPPKVQLPERLASVQSVLYLIFNEGYAATSGPQLVRTDLCAEAIRLAKLLFQLLPKEPENAGLLALMLLQDSRREARVSVEGDLVTLEEQDRSLWDLKAIKEGVDLVDLAFKQGAPGPYSLQAAIAALHARAPSSEKTDWKHIAALYDALLRVNQSPVVRLNRAVAVALGFGLQIGLEHMNQIQELEDYYLFHAARADLLRRLGRRAESAHCYARALELATNNIERRFLSKRLEQVQGQ